MNSNLRMIIGAPLNVFFTLYVMTLTCSIAGMELAAWISFFFLVLYVIADRVSPNRELEIHTIGVELPFIAFLIIVILGLRINAPNADFFEAVSNLRNVFLLYSFTYTLQTMKNLNRLMALLAGLATIVAGYAIWQHFTGIDIWRHSNRALIEVPWGERQVFQSVGFFNDHLSYSHSFTMILCIPWAALLLARRAPAWLSFIFLTSVGIILTSILFSYARGAWIACLVVLPVMAFFASRKFFIVTVIALAIFSSLFYRFSPIFKERAQSILSESYTNNEDRKKLWHINMEMFRDHPWIGVGYKQNEPLSPEYFAKLGITDGTGGNAHSNYVELLATTGLLGFASYMLFIIAYLLMTARLFAIIPASHYWHRVFALSALGAQVAFHVGGLTHWNFGDMIIQHQFFFWLAVVAYMSQRYFLHIVSDDHSL